MRENVHSIQFLRFIAAALVVITHIALAFPIYYPNAISPATVHVAESGGVGVHIFFVISGFVMVYTSFAGVDHPFQPQKFFFRRFVRIYPIYWIYAAAYLLFNILFAAGYVAPSSGTIVGALLLLPGSSAAIIGPGWTLAFEVFFYACFGCAMILGLRRGLILLTLSFFVLIALRPILKVNDISSVLHVVTNSLLIEFLLGAWIGYLVVLKRNVGPTLAKAMIVGSFVVFGAGVFFGHRSLPTVVVWGIPSTMLVAGLVFLERGGRVSETVRGFAWLGDSSYSLYLLHVLLIDIMMRVVLYFHPVISSNFETAAIFAVFLVLNIAICVAAYNLIERPLVLTLQKRAALRELK